MSLTLSFESTLPASVSLSGSVSVVDLDGFAPTPPSPGTFAAFCTTSQFTLTIADPAATPFDIITFDYFGPVIVRIRHDESATPIDALLDGYTGYDEWRTFGPYEIDRNLYGKLTSIDFVFNTLTGNDGFAIDNIVLDTQATPPPVILANLDATEASEDADTASFAFSVSAGGTGPGLNVIRPIPITDATLISSTVPETLAEYSAGTTYSEGQSVRIAATNRAYTSLVSSNTGNDPATSPLHWIDDGPTNRWAMFDDRVSTITTGASDPLEVVVAPGTINAIAMFGVIGSSLTVLVQDGASGPVVYGYGRSLDGTVIADWFQYFYEAASESALVLLTDLPTVRDAYVTVRISGGGTLAIGLLVVGVQYFVGSLRVGARVGIKDFSRKDTDEFGNTTFVRRGFKQTFEGTFEVRLPQFTKVHSVLTNELRSRPCVWIGSQRSEYQPLVVYGYYVDFGITVAYPTFNLCDIQIEGLL